MSTAQTDFLRYLRTLTAQQATGILSDQQLLERFLHERSEASFAALVARHGPMVLSVCRRVLQHAAGRRGCISGHVPRIGAQGRFHPQASVVGQLAARRRLSQRRMLASQSERLRCPRAPRQSLSVPREALDDITWRELRSVLDHELRRLPEQYRAPLVLCYLEGKTQDEGARQLGWSKNTFRRRLESGRASLGRRLTRRGVTLAAALSAPLLTDALTQACAAAAACREHSSRRPRHGIGTSSCSPGIGTSGGLGR